MFKVQSGCGLKCSGLSLNRRKILDKTRSNHKTPQVTRTHALIHLSSAWAPFFFQSGRLLTRSSVTHLLQDSARCAGLPYKSLKGHSFRIGAASAAAAVGSPGWLIKVLGRWSSDCYQLYIRTPETVLLSAVPKMARVSGNFI